MLKKKLKSTDMIMWNGVDIELYARSHDPTCIHTVLQFLELFKWDKNAEAALRYLADTKYKLGMVKPSEKGQLRKKKPIIEEPEVPVFVVGVCPKCEEKLLGEPVAACETRGTGRVFVKECSVCTYYCELFRKDDKLTEIEGE
jgi:hypothetical protein